MNFQVDFFSIENNFAFAANVLKLDTILIVEEPAYPMQLNLAYSTTMLTIKRKRLILATVPFTTGGHYLVDDDNKEAADKK
jgi:hypothetical protein